MRLVRGHSWPPSSHECVVDGRMPRHLLVVGREESVPEQQILLFFKKGPQFGSSSSRIWSRGICCQDRDCRCAETGPRARSGVRSRVAPRTDPSEGSIHRTGHDEEGADEVSRLEEGEKRLEELRAVQLTQPGPPPAPVPDASSEVARLKQMVTELHMCLAILQSFLHSVFGRGRITSRLQSRR